MVLGMVLTGDRLKEYQKEYNSRPENKERKREYNKDYNSRPENKERRREQQKEYRSRPEVRERDREYVKDYRSRPENKERRREYYSKPENKERIRKKNIEKKLIVYNHYSDNDIMCKQCGMRDIDALSLDHIYDNGSHHRKKVNVGNFYNWIIKNNFPPILQVLCMNCNMIKERRRRRNKNKTQF